MIPEPQQTYVLELFAALGPAAEGFVLPGAQAMKFAVPSARATKDFDFVLEVLSFRKLDTSLAEILSSLGYRVIARARNFQFENRNFPIRLAGRSIGFFIVRKVGRSLF